MSEESSHLIFKMLNSFFFDARVTLRKVADWCRNRTRVASRAPFPRVWVAEEAEELIARRRGLVPP